MEKSECLKCLFYTTNSPKLKIFNLQSNKTEKAAILNTQKCSKMLIILLPIKKTPIKAIEMCVWIYICPKHTPHLLLSISDNMLHLRFKALLTLPPPSWSDTSQVPLSQHHYWYSLQWYDMATEAIQCLFSIQCAPHGRLQCWTNMPPNHWSISYLVFIQIKQRSWMPQKISIPRTFIDWIW